MYVIHIAINLTYVQSFEVVSSFLFKQLKFILYV